MRTLDKIRMNLFEQNIDSNKNWLPYNGTVRYWAKIFSNIECEQFYNRLMGEIAWKNDEAVIFGKHIITKRKTAWYADSPYEYTYSKIRRTALLWSDLLIELKQIIEEKTEQIYNSCLLNLYHTGNEGMDWHSDNEPELIPNGSIASLSFGATRRFAIKHKRTKYKQIFDLNAGDLLEMKDETQSYWVHNIAKTKRIFTPRINLTFRQMIE